MLMHVLLALRLDHLIGAVFREYQARVLTLRSQKEQISRTFIACHRLQTTFPMPTIIRHTRLSQHDTRMYTKEIIVSICFPFSHALLASVPICSILFSPSDLVSSRRMEDCVL